MLFEFSFLFLLKIYANLLAVVIPSQTYVRFLVFFSVDFFSCFSSACLFTLFINYYLSIFVVNIYFWDCYEWIKHYPVDPGFHIKFYFWLIFRNLHSKALFTLRESNRKSEISFVPDVFWCEPIITCSQLFQRGSSVGLVTWSPQR